MAGVGATRRAISVQARFVGDRDALHPLEVQLLQLLEELVDQVNRAPNPVFPRLELALATLRFPDMGVSLCE